MGTRTRTRNAFAGLDLRLKFPDAASDFAQGNGSPMFSGGDQRRHRLVKIKRINFLEIQFAALQRAEEFGIGPASGTKGLHRHHGAARVLQMAKQQTSEQRLANASIGASNENYPGSHVGKVAIEDFREAGKPVLIPHQRAR